MVQDDVGNVPSDGYDGPCPKSKEKKTQEKSRTEAKMQNQQEKNPPEPSQSTEQSDHPKLNLITKGHGTRVSRLKSWSDKATKLTDKLMELADILYTMDKNDAPMDENFCFLMN